MKVEKVTECTNQLVETTDGDYVRYGEDNWFKWYGESLEPHYACENIEEAYQKFIDGA